MVTRGNVRDTTSPPRFRLGYAILLSLLPAKQGSPYPGGEGGQKVSPTVTTSGRGISFIDFSSVNSRGKKKEHFCPTGAKGLGGKLEKLQFQERRYSLSRRLVSHVYVDKERVDRNIAPLLLTDVRRSFLASASSETRRGCRDLRVAN